jgi:CBS domain-containing protein
MNKFCIKEYDNILSAIDKMSIMNISMLVVTNDNLSVEGVLTQGDIIHLFREGFSTNISLNRVMTTNFVYLELSDLSNRFKLHRRHKIPYIPILNENELIGISSIFEEKIISNE